MNLEERKQELLKSIHHLLNDYVNNTIDENSAKSKYDLLLSDFNELKKDYIITGDNNNFLKDNLFFFNINNFSKFSAIIKLENSNIDFIEIAGDLQFKELIKNILINNSMPVNNPHLIVNQNNLDYNLFHQKISNEEKIFFIAITSSKFFKQNIFEKFSEDLNKNEFLILDKKDCYSFFDTFKKEFISFLSAKLKEQNELILNYVVIENFINVFGHLGHVAILLKSKEIKKELANYFNIKNKIIQFSIVEYFFISEVNDSFDEKDLKVFRRNVALEKLLFSIKVKQLKINKNEDIYLKLHEIF